MTKTSDDLIEGLDERQSEFLKKYLPKVRLFSKAKDLQARQDVIDQYKKFVRERDELVLEQRARLSELSPAWTDISETIKRAELKGNRDGKTLDFESAAELLQEARRMLEEAINEQNKSPTLSTAADAQLQIDNEFQRYQTVFDKAQPKLRYRSKETTDSVAKNLAETKQSREVAREKVAKAFHDLAKDEIKCQFAVQDVAHEFSDLIDVAIKKSRDLVAGAKLQKVDLKLLVNDEKYKHLATEFKREEERVKFVERELMDDPKDKDPRPTLSQTLKNLQSKIDRLQKEYGDEKVMSKKSKIGAEIKQAVAEKKALGIRMSQLKRYKEGEPGVGGTQQEDGQQRRLELMLLADEKCKYVTKAPTQELAKQLKTATQSPSFGFTPPTDSKEREELRKALRKKNKEMKEHFFRASERVIREGRLDPNEPELMEISGEQLNALNRLIDFADKLLSHKDGELELALAAQNDAYNLYYDFVASRKISLPAPREPEPSDAEKLKADLTPLLTRSLNVEALGYDGRDSKKRTLSQKCLEFIKEVGNTDTTVLTPEKQKEIAEAIDQLTKDVELAEAKVKRKELSSEGKKLREQAKAAKENINKELLKLYRTTKITKQKDIDRIEDRNQSYSDEQREDLIPFDQVITVTEYDEEARKEVVVHYRILVYDGPGGLEHDRRKEKDIPREVLAQMRNRADALEMMMETATEDADELIMKYLEETETFVKAVTDKSGPKGTTGRELYKKIEEMLAEIREFQKTDELKRYLPSDLPVRVKERDSFLKNYRDRLPQKAHDDLKTIHEAFKSLILKAKGLRTQKREALDLAKRIDDDLTSRSSKEVGMDLDQTGSVMERLFQDKSLTARIVKLLDEIDGADDKRVPLSNDGKNSVSVKELRGKLEGYLKSIEDAQTKFNDPKKNKTELDTFEGRWRKDVLSAWQMLRDVPHSETAIIQALTIVYRVEDELTAFRNKCDKLKDTLNPANASDPEKLNDTLKFLADLTQRMTDGADGAEKVSQARQQWEAGRESLKKKLEQFKKRLKHVVTGKELLEGKYSALKANGELTKKKVDKFHDYEWGNEQYADYLKQADQLLEDAGEKPEGGRENPVKILPHIGALQKSIARLGERVKTLAVKQIKDPAAGLDQTSPIRANAEVAVKLLEQIGKVTDLKLTELTKLCEAIDQKQAVDKKEKIKHREAALAELHRIRDAVYKYPAMEVYRTNPFDKGATLRILSGALQQAEVGILASVDRRESY